MFYVYGLIRPNDVVFYIGKGKRDRMYRHVQEANRGHKCHKCNVIRKILRDGHEVTYRTYWIGDDENEAIEQEKYWIAFYGIENLTNCTIGGLGTSGYKRTEQECQRIRDRWSDPEYKDRVSASIRHHARTAKGRKQRSEQIQNYYTQNPDARKRAGELSRQRQQDPDIRKRLSEHSRSRWQDPEYHARESEKVRQRQQSPESRQRQSEQSRLYWQDTERREHFAEQSRQRWQDPEYKKRVGEKIRQAKLGKKRKSRRSA